MSKTATLPATSDAIELLTKALSEGHAITLSLATAPQIVQPPPLVTICCFKFGLTPSQARVFATLLEHDYVARADLHIAMCRDGKVSSKVKTVDVVVSQIRQKLATHDVKIIPVWKQGYRLAEDSRDRIRELLGAGIADLTYSSNKDVT